MTPIYPGAIVRHPAYSKPGAVLTVAYDWRRQPSMAVVAFTIGGHVQRRDVWVADLTPVAVEAA